MSMHPLLVTALASVVLNAAGFLNGFLRQTDKLTDLLYSVSFAAAAALAWWLIGQPGGLSAVLLAMVLSWSLRLGGYLFRRILHMDSDARFDDMRPNPWRLAGFWTLQTVTVWVVLLPFPLVLWQQEAGLLHTPDGIPDTWSSIHGVLLLGGIVVWLLGLWLEAVADAQKFRFKKEHPDRFMQQGVWSRLRHPNYTGEILAWIGFATTAASALSGWPLALAWIGPVWIAVLLIKVSGIPLLERSHAKRYGDDPAFQAYVAKSDRLIPGLW